MRKILIACCSIILIACETGKEEKNNFNKPVKSLPKVTLNFISDSAFIYVKRQTDFGPRVPNSEAHFACKKWLVQKLKGYNLNVTQQSFVQRAYNNKKLKLTNIIAEYNPSAKKRIIIAAHWDSRHIAENDTVNVSQPIDGANDGASGVGVILELARIVSKEKLNCGIDFILFDGEDYGQPEGSEFPYMADSWCFGAQYWAKNKHKNNYFPDYGILLDMVGAKGARFSKEGVSRTFANNIVEKVWRTGHQSGYSDYFIYRNSEQITDDHLYVNRIGQIPMIDIIDNQPYSKNGSYFGDYHHTHQDNIDIIDKSTLKAVGQTLANLLAKE